MPSAILGAPSRLVSTDLGGSKNALLPVNFTGIVGLCLLPGINELCLLPRHGL